MSFLKYTDFIDKIGSTFDIKNGMVVEDPSGFLTVRTTFVQDSIYLNNANNSVVILSTNQYLGREYSLGNADCLTLTTSWLDTHHGTDYLNWYKAWTRRKFVDFYKNGCCVWFESEPGFVKINNENIIKGDVIVYAFREGAINHCGIYLDNNKIMHHIPKRLSCIDDLD